MLFVLLPEHLLCRVGETCPRRGPSRSTTSWLGLVCWGEGAKLAVDHAVPDRKAAGGWHRQGGAFSSPKQADMGGKIHRTAGSQLGAGQGRLNPGARRALQTVPSPSSFSLIAQRGLPGTACFLPRAGTKPQPWGWDVLTRRRGIRPWKRGLTGLGFAGERCSAARPAVARSGDAPLRWFAPKGCGSAAPRGLLTLWDGSPPPQPPCVPWGGWRLWGSTADSQGRVPTGVSVDLTHSLNPLGQDVGLSARVWVQSASATVPLPAAALFQSPAGSGRGGGITLLQTKPSCNLPCATSVAGGSRGARSAARASNEASCRSGCPPNRFITAPNGLTNSIHIHKSKPEPEPPSARSAAQPRCGQK